MEMMKITLLADGSSDRALVPIIRWLFSECGIVPMSVEYADLARLPSPPSALKDRIRLSFDLWPCDVLCVHRDAEAMDPKNREIEIERAVASLVDDGCQDLPSVISVVPVRMQEAWMLIDEAAIRLAAGNPRGKTPLMLPRIKDLEALSDPKDVLYGLLRSASELNGRRLKKFSPAKAAHRVAEMIDDFTLLNCLPAFQRFRDDVSNLVSQRV